MSKSLSLILIYDWECPVSSYSFFDVGSDKPYFSIDEENLFQSWFKTKIEDQLTAILNTKAPVSIYFSGTFLELLYAVDPNFLKRIKSAKHINLLGGTYHHSLVSLFSKSHFQREIIWHQKLIKKQFGVSPTCFLNTTNVYFNDLADQISSLGYTTTFAGAVDWYLGEQKNQRIFHSRANDTFKLLLINQDGGHTLFHEPEVKHVFLQLNEDTLTKYGGWKELIRKSAAAADLISIDEQIKNVTTNSYNIRQPISSSYDQVELDQLKNYPLQESWLTRLYELEKSIAKKPEKLQKIWSRLGSISVLKNLNPELEAIESKDSYDTYQSLINILSDLQLKL